MLPGDAGKRPSVAGGYRKLDDFGFGRLVLYECRFVRQPRTCTPFLGGAAVNEDTQQFEPSTVTDPARLGTTLLAFDTSSMVNMGLASNRYQVNSVNLKATWTYDSDPNVLLYQNTPITQAEMLTEVSSGDVTRKSRSSCMASGLRRLHRLRVQRRNSRAAAGGRTYPSLFGERRRLYRLPDCW